MQEFASGLSRPRSSGLWFALFVGLVCFWVLSLPVFPSQDGPMHRYYAHALGAVLNHQPLSSFYAVRHPFPPYATQYLSLIGLFHFFSFDWAEKIFTCLEILCFAFGARFCATAVGPAGAWVSLLIAPLLLPWYLMMGFFNYSIGIGIALCAVGFWLRLDRSRASLAGFVIAVLVLIFSHPVPLLLLLVFLVADLLRRRFLIPQTAGWLRANTRQSVAFVYTVCLSLYPALAIDKTKTASTLSGIGFHLPFVRTALLLTGISPYNTRSHGLWVNSYRVALYLLLAASLVWGVQAFRKSVASRELSAAGAFLVYAVVFALALPILPDDLNGGVFFATRMVIMVWIFAMLAASGRSVESARFRNACVALGAVFTVLTLVPFERIVRPLARSLQRVEAQTLPSRTQALMLNGPELVPMARSEYDLAFDPFLWANVLPLVRKNDLVLDAPWLQLSISPLRAASGAPEWVDATALTEVKATDPPIRLDSLLPGAQVEDAVRRASVIVYAGTGQELGNGLVPFLGSRDAAEFTCKRVETWSLTCLRNPVVALHAGERVTHAER